MKEKSASSSGNAGHRQRLRERFLRCGLKALAPHEIIELLLTYSIPQKDVKPLAKTLLTKFGSVDGVLNASPQMLMELPGIKENTAALLTFFPALNESLREDEMLSGNLIENPLAAVRYLQTKIGRENREVLAMIYLDGSNHVQGFEFQTGRPKKVSFYPQNVACGILRNNASGVIIAHNHPSGVCRPSDADIKATTQLRTFLKQMDLRLVDHLLITRVSHVSLLNLSGCIFKNYTSEVLETDFPDTAFDNNNSLPLDCDEVQF